MISKYGFGPVTWGIIYTALIIFLVVVVAYGVDQLIKGLDVWMSTKWGI